LGPFVFAAAMFSFVTQVRGQDWDWWDWGWHSWDISGF
jgi:hypothetical protein